MKTAITPTWDELENERSAWFYLFGRLKPGVSMEQAEAALRVLYRQRQEEELKGELFQRFPDARARFLKQTFTAAGRRRAASRTCARASSGRSSCSSGSSASCCSSPAPTSPTCCWRARRRASARWRSAPRSAPGAASSCASSSSRASSWPAPAASPARSSASSCRARWSASSPSIPPTLAIQTTPDLRVLAFTAAVSLLTALVFGLVPALQGSRVSPGLAMKEESGSVTGGHVRLRKTLVGAAGRPRHGAADRRRALRPHAAEPAAGGSRLPYRARRHVRRPAGDGLRRGAQARRCSGR